MPYGQGGRLGDTINPALMMADYGGFANAGMIKGQMFQNAGEQIGETLKLRGNQDKFIKTQIQAANAIKKALPDVGTLVDDALVKLNDPEASHRDRLAMAESIQESLKIGLLGMDQQRADEQMMLERMKLAASMQGGAQSMRVTPEQLNQMRDSGAKVTVENMLPDGSYVVKTAVWGEQPLVNIGGGVDANGNIIPGGQARPSSAIPNFGYGAAGSIPSPEGVVPQEILPGMEGDPMSWQRPDAAAGINSAIGVAIDGSPGVLNPRPASVPAPQSPLASYFNAGSPARGDVYQLNAQGRPIGVVREPGSTPEIEYRLKEQQLQKGAAETEKARAESEAAKQKAQQLQDAKNNFSDSISAMTGAYSELQKRGGAVESGRGVMENIGSALASTRMGQTVGGAMGTEEANYRQVIKSTLPDIINVIRQASEMGAKGMDTPKELEFFLAAAGDMTKPIESNLKALMKLDKVYGNGDAVEKMLQNNPALLRKVRAFDLKLQPQAEDKRGAAEKYLSPATRAYLESINAK